MKRFLLLFALIALFAVNKVSALKTGDVFVTSNSAICVYKNGTAELVRMTFLVISEDLKYVSP